MAKYRKKPIVIEAEQWFKYGDHPEVEEHYSPHACSICGGLLELNHGWIETLEGGHIVCPGDWIIKGVKGELYPCKPDIFEMTYERAEGEKGG